MPSAEFEALRPQLEVILLTEKLAAGETIYHIARFAREALKLVEANDEYLGLRYAQFAIGRFEGWQHEQPRS